MDGAAGVSQCPIAPGAQFIYNFTIPADQSGTFWYHAHSGVLRGDGLYGGLVVHAPAAQTTVRGLMSRGRGDAQRFNYEKELLLLIGDWYHRPSSHVLAWYKLPGNFGNEVRSSKATHIARERTLMFPFSPLAGAGLVAGQWSRPFRMLDGRSCSACRLY